MNNQKVFIKDIAAGESLLLRKNNEVFENNPQFGKVNYFVTKDTKDSGIFKKSDHSNLTNLLNEFSSTQNRNVSNIFNVVISSCKMFKNSAADSSEQLIRNVNVKRPTVKESGNLQNCCNLSSDLRESLNENHLNVLTKTLSNTEGDGNFKFWLNGDNNLSKMTFCNYLHSKKSNFHILSPDNFHLSNLNSIQEPSKKKKVGRPKRTHEFEPDQSKSFKKIKEQQPIEEPLMRTKCGRPTKMIFKTNYVPEINNEKCIHEDYGLLNKQPEFIKLPSPKRNRNISSNFRCQSCNKIYLGKNKMNHHYKLFPSHKPKELENDSVLYSYLMSTIHQKYKNNEDKANFLLKELSNFVEKMQKLTPKLITNNMENSVLEKVDKNTASLLRINPGDYRFNLNVFDRNFNVDNPTSNESERELNSTESHSNELHEEENFGYHDKESLEGVIHLENNSIISTGLKTHNAIHNLDTPSLDCTEVNNIIIHSSNQELTHLTNISDIVGDKIEESSNLCLRKSTDIIIQQSDESIFNENTICDNSNLVKKLPLLDLSTELFQ